MHRLECLYLNTSTETYVGLHTHTHIFRRLCCVMLNIRVLWAHGNRDVGCDIDVSTITVSIVKITQDKSSYFQLISMMTSFWIHDLILVLINLLFLFYLYIFIFATGVSILSKGPC